MNRYAVIVAGGRGSRMQSELPKQFMLLHGRPVLMHTIAQFASAIDGIKVVLVLPSDQTDTWYALCRHHDFQIPHEVIIGGEARYDSVKAGLAACPDDGIVGIHDGVRPLVSQSMIRRCYQTCETHGSALPVVPVTQSLRKVDGLSSVVMSREGVVEVQTPQCFLLEQLKPCYAGEALASFTDDATVFEAAGNKVHLVDGESSNLKITTPSDLKIAEAILGMTHS